MEAASRVFETRKELEDAFHDDTLKYRELYYIKNIDKMYRLDVTRKGFVEIPRSQWSR